MNNLLLLGILLAVALASESMSRILRLPQVTGYVILGVICGKSLIGLFGDGFLTDAAVVNDFALGAMAFTIVSELKGTLFRSLGKSIFFIVIFEAIGAFLLVAGSMYLMHPDKLYQALVLGSVASATAPAATVAVLSQYKAKGPLTSTILAVVGIDDAIALIIFAFATTIAKAVMRGTSLSVSEIIGKPLVEIGGSLILGILVAFLFRTLFGKTRHPDLLLIRIAAAMILIMGISTQFGLSELLAIMAYAAVIVNIDPALNNRSLNIVTHLGPLFYAMFFTLAGARLDIKLLPVVGVMGLVYTAARMIGKTAGGTLGAALGKAPEVVKKYVGLGLIPQVGVAIALAILVDKMFGTGAFGEAGLMLSKVVINILLFTTIITEIVGPILTRFAVTKAGERNDSGE